MSTHQTTTQKCDRCGASVTLGYSTTNAWLRLHTFENMLGSIGELDLCGTCRSLFQQFMGGAPIANWEKE